MTDALEQLIQLLARLVADGDISEAQAETILVYWQGRPADELARVLPLALAQGVGPLEDDRDNEIFVLLLLIAGGEPAMSRSVAIAAANRAQDKHAALSAQLAADLEARRITVAEWQARQRILNAGALQAMAALGDRRLSASFQRRLDEIEREQAAYLQRFADGLAARHLTAPMPEDDNRSALAPWVLAYIARRAASYSGAGRGAFFTALESSGEQTGPGWVVHYEARDDDRTCSACRGAEGYYLPGQGPMPGDVCFGGGACRCERVAVYDPARYAQLVGVGVTP